MRSNALAGVVALAWVTSFIATFVARRFASTLGLVDAPNQRSSHRVPTPSGGGLGLVCAGTLAAAVLPIRADGLWVVVCFSLVMAGVGLRDDIRHVSASIRFATQLLVSAGALVALGVVEVAHPLVVTLVLFGGVWWINLFNFMDGIDGIAGSQAVFMLLAAAVLAAWHRPAIAGAGEWMWMLAIAAAVVAFLPFNWPPAKIFMGDVGSTWLAYIVFSIAVVSVSDGWLTVQAWLILGGFFIVDSTVTLLRRMFRRARWFEAHRSHAYQRLAIGLKGHRPVTLFAICVNVLWLSPWAWAAMMYPKPAWIFLMLAYVPLTIAALAVGAGGPDRSSTDSMHR